MTNLPTSHSRSDSGDGEGDDEEQEFSKGRNHGRKREMSNSYQDLQSAGVVMDFEPDKVFSVCLVFGMWLACRLHALSA